MRWNTFGRSAAFAALAGTSVLPWVVITGPLLGMRCALAVYLVALTVTTVTALAPSLRRGLGVGLIVALLGSCLAVATRTLPELVLGLAVLFGMARAVFLYRLRPTRAVAVEVALIGGVHELRNVAAPQVPVPLQHVAAVAYGDEAHVEENRRLYRIKFDLADQILGSRYGYRRPDAGFCVWLNTSELGDDVSITLKLFKEAGVRVVPGSFLARLQPDGFNPGAGYIRLALVQDGETTAQALHRLVETLG